MSADEKKCPRCAETVKAEAKICRFCGHNFETGSPASGHHQPPPAKNNTGRNVGIGCVTILVLLVIIAAISSPVSEGQQNGAPQQPAIQVTARELAAAYDANEAAAQERYGDRVLEVTGTISAIQLGITDEPFIVLEGTNMFAGPQASLVEASQRRASSLSRGQEIRLRCQGVGEIIGTAMLRDCEIL